MKNLLLSQRRCKCLQWETNAGRRHYLDIESTSVSSKAVAFGCGGVKLEVVNLQRLQSHRGAFWVMTMMHCADCCALLQKILHYCTCIYLAALALCCHTRTHTYAHARTSEEQRKRAVTWTLCDNREEWRRRSVQLCAHNQYIQVTGV